MNKLLKRFWAKVDKTDGCWVWTAGKNRTGYGRINIAGKNCYAHRVSWELAHGSPPPDCLLHKCDNPACVRPDHLFEGTRADNVYDMVNKGRARWGTVRGVNHGGAKLTEKNVRAIREDPRTQLCIAIEYRVSRALVGLIKSRELWSHVT